MNSQRNDKSATPSLMVSPEGDLILLVSHSDKKNLTGTVVWTSGGTNWTLGDSRDDWCAVAFQPYPGTVTLS